MALQDILAAISAQADQKITEARTLHQKHLTQVREVSERNLAKKKQDIALQKEQRKAQLKAKAENHAVMIKRNALLKKKQELLDQMYNQVDTQPSSSGWRTPTSSLWAIPSKRAAALSSRRKPKNRTAHLNIWYKRSCDPRRSSKFLLPSSLTHRCLN